jgi:phage terminase large subunit-like protein
LDFFLIEDRASGISLIQELQDVGLPVIPYMPDKDKISRAHAASAIIHSGRVYLNQALMFSQEFLSEVMKFPASGRDTVDAMSQAILWMKNNWHIIPKDYTFYRTEEARPEFQRRPSTYWSSVSKH